MITTEHVLHQHAVESSILWLRRTRAVAEPHFRLDDLARLDGRLEAHLDGLRIADRNSDPAWEICEEELRRWQEPGEVFAAAALALDPPNERRLARVLEAATASRDLARPLASAIAWLPPEFAARWTQKFLDADDAALRRIGLAAAAIGRCDPGRSLAGLLQDQHDLLRARGLRAVGELGRVDLVEHARDNLHTENAEVSFWAAWSAAILSADPKALEALRRVATLPGPWQARALQMALRRMEPIEAKSWHDALWQRASPPRIALVAAAVLGMPEPVAALIDLMAASSTARAAGEAFTMITGVDIVHQRLDRPRPAGFESGPSEDPADDDVEMDPDENLPWPDQDKIAAWWKKHEAEFAPGTRYLLGKPMSEDWLEQVLRHGYQRQRAAAALELAIRRPGTSLLEVRAPGFRQQELLG